MTPDYHAFVESSLAAERDTGQPVGEQVDPQDLGWQQRQRQAD